MMEGGRESEAEGRERGGRERTRESEKVGGERGERGEWSDRQRHIEMSVSSKTARTRKTLFFSELQANDLQLSACMSFCENQVYRP